jgi:cytochrome P450/CRP-like cAMP-binding protein
MRRLLRPGYSREAMERNLPALADSIEKLLQGLDRKRPIAVRELMQRLITEQVALAALGRASGEYFRDAAKFSSTLVGASLGRWPRFYLRLPGYRRARARMHALAEQIVAERRARPRGEEKGADLADIWLGGEDIDGKKFEGGDVIFGILGAFIAGMDTAASAAAFLTWELLRQPELLARVIAEVDETFESGVPTAQRLRQMRTLRGALLETLRLHPITATLLRHAVEPFEFAGHQIPAGEPILIALTVTHFQPDLFPDPLRFDIERFAEPRNEDKQPGAYVPFGVSHHVCLGTGQAEISIMMATAVLLRTLRAELDPPGYQLRGVMAPLPTVEPACRLRLGETRHSLSEHQERAAAHKREQMAMVLPTLDRHLLADLAARVATRKYAAGKEIVREGDVADRFFMILEGEVEVLQGTQKLRQMSAGSYFGEVGLLTGGKRSATVRALGEVTLLELDDEAFRTIIDNCDLTSEEIARVMRERVVATQLTTALPSLDSRIATALAPAIERKQFAAGDVIVRQGDEAHHFYILTRGACDVLARGPAGQELAVGELVAGDFFGERGLLLGVPRTATVRAREPVETLEISREGFRSLVEDAQLAHEEIARVMRRRMEASAP